MEGDLDQKLATIVENEPWWLGFIDAVKTHEANLVGLDPNNPIPLSVASTRTLNWAINTTAAVFESPEFPTKQFLYTYVIESGGGLISFLNLLKEICRIVPISVKVSAIIREFVNPRNAPYRTMAVNQLIIIEPLEDLLKVISDLQTERIRTLDKEALALLTLANNNTFWILSCLAQKDSKFPLKLRSLQKVKFLHETIRDVILSLKCEIHFPCLKLIRVLVKNALTAAILTKDKVFNTLKKLMELYNSNPSVRFQMVFDILVILTRNSKLNCKRFLKAGMLVCLMRVFNYWTSWKGKGLLKMSKCVLNIYTHLAGTYAGRKALLGTDALINIRKFCESCPNDKHFDEVMMRALGLMCLAYGKHKLPFKDLSSPAKFEIPQLDDSENANAEMKDSGTSSDEDDPDDAGEDGDGSDNDSKPDDEDDEDDADDTNVDTETCTSDIEPDDENLDVDADDVEDDEDMLLSVTSMKCAKPKKGILARTANISKSESQVRPWTARRDSLKTPVEQATSDKKSIEPKFVDLGYFFKELDGKVGDASDFFSNYSRNKDSVVIGLLGRTIAKQTSGVIPKSVLNYHWLTDHPHYGDSKAMEDMRRTYLHISRQVRSVIPFVKVAYPEITFAYNGKFKEILPQSADRFVLRSKLLSLMGRAAGGESFKPRVVYDLDQLLGSKDTSQPKSSKRKASLPSSSLNSGLSKKKGSSITVPVTLPDPTPEELCNNDEKEVGQLDRKSVHSLKFESRFEGGNLRRAVQVAEREYDLYLMSDVNSKRHNQWFYFQVSNTIDNASFTFNIVNCIKTNSQFNFGMQPVVFSVMEAMDGRPGWVRAGTNVCYYRNGYRNLAGKKKKAKLYHSASFTLSFGKKGDICYVAYHYPYSYSRLLTELWKMTKEARQEKRVVVRYDVLCNSLNQNEVPMVTVTAPSEPRYPVELRDIIVLTSRVHPGEPNSSWIMHGILHQLLFGKDMNNLLSRYVFKIVPMLNVEGVINGCGRCGLTDEDLNRRWINPNPILHPSIYNTKAMIEYCCKVRNKVPVLYCDLHGHSRRKNVFFYGCSMAKSWCAVDRAKPENPQAIQALPEAMSRRAPAFSLEYCNFDVRKQRESTARIALWREFGISRSYTLESTYCGCDRGIYKGLSLGIHHLIEVGETLCAACEEIEHPSFSCPPAALYKLPFQTDVQSSSSANENRVSSANLEDASCARDCWRYESEKETTSTESSEEAESEWNEMNTMKWF